MGLGRKLSGTGQVRRLDAAPPERDMMVEVLKELHGRICLTSHQKCLIWGSLNGKAMVRTRLGAGLEAVR
jgi:hypothetical protein